SDPHPAARCSDSRTHLKRPPACWSALSMPRVLRYLSKLPALLVPQRQDSLLPRATGESILWENTHVAVLLLPRFANPCTHAPDLQGSAACSIDSGIAGRSSGSRDVHGTQHQ